MEAGVIVPIDTSDAVYPPGIQKEDPNHLDNLLRRLHSLNNQSAADTKYDPKPPPRINKEGHNIEEMEEGFEAEITASDTKLTGQLLYAFGACSAIIFIMTLFAYLDPYMYRSITEVKNGFKYVNISAGIALINIIFVYFSLKKNEIMLWYPPLKDARIWY